ncbi:MAG: TldD/PmbA family protein [Nitrososphaeria archaeon]|nr:TldD/PmbA family protein [Nitrososphaeria archaeon]
MSGKNLDLEIPFYIVREIEETGAEYVEARLHTREEIGCILKNGQLEPAIVTSSYGLGVRALFDGTLVFSATNIIDRENAKKVIEETLKKGKNASNLTRNKIKFSREKRIKKKWAAVEHQKLMDKSFEELIKMLRELDNIVLEEKDYIPMRFLELEISAEKKLFTNSQGTFIEGYVPRLYIGGFLTGLKEGKSVQKTIEFGGSGGWEIITELEVFEKFRKQVQVIKEILEKGQKTVPGIYDIITGPEVTGIMVHESIGHPFEADRILGREGAQAGESYLKPTDMGRRIGSEEANISDDPTIPNSYGFYLYDDEGVPARRRKLVVNGVVNELLHNRATAREFKTKSNGAARANKFDREPIVRMANTYVEPGDYTFEELIKDVKKGIFVNSFMEWNIDDIRWNQRYVGHETYLIENGEIKHPLINPVIEVTTERLWSSLDARGKEIQFWAATCGKGDPMQGAPVWAGGPYLRFRNLEVKTR